MTSFGKQTMPKGGVLLTIFIFVLKFTWVMRCFCFLYWSFFPVSLFSAHFFCQLLNTLALKFSLFISDRIDVLVRLNLNWNSILCRHGIFGVLYVTDDESDSRKILHLCKMDSSCLVEGVQFSSCLSPFPFHQWLHDENNFFFFLELYFTRNLTAEFSSKTMRK